MQKIRKYRAEIIFIFLAVAAIFLVVWLVPPREPVVVEEVVPEPVKMFGLPVDSFLITEGIVRSNQNLSDILVNYGVSMGEIDQLAKASRDTFDVRKIRVGQKYYIFQTQDSGKKAAYFVYENTTANYVVFDLDTLRSYNGQKEIRVEQSLIQGTIKSSLWNALEERGHNPVLALDMSEIYAWTIDFFGLQKGDAFKVLYDEQFVEDKPIGLGNIHAALFKHGGKDYYAFRFFDEEGFHYYDETGKNLKGAFLKAPLQFSRISSRFSNSRLHPVLRIRRPHHGVDYAAPKGTPVRTIGDGLVVEKAYQASGGGNYLKIKHNAVYTTVYMHLSGYAKGIAKGTRVSQGDVIGYVGSTGLSSGPHLDFRVFQNGSPIDPLTMKSEPGKPVSATQMAQYRILCDSLKTRLDQLKWE
jgi:murein DD-endopeptidase MepM/ murein hydrolase activator NlpD